MLTIFCYGITTALEIAVEPDHINYPSCVDGDFDYIGYAGLTVVDGRSALVIKDSFAGINYFLSKHTEPSYASYSHYAKMRKRIFELPNTRESVLLPVYAYAYNKMYFLGMTRLYRMSYHYVVLEFTDEKLEAHDGFYRFYT